jgi:FeS assembly SUF system protein
VSDDYHYPKSLVSLPVARAANVNEPRRDMQEPTPDPAPTPQETAPSPAPPADPTGFVEQKLVEGKVIEALKEVYDPEIPVNIYELGLIYDIQVDAENKVMVKMTLTAPACPVAGTLPGEVERRIEAIPEVKAATVELVWDPPWSRDRMSEAALLQLGMF